MKTPFLRTRLVAWTLAASAGLAGLAGCSGGSDEAETAPTPTPAATTRGAVALGSADASRRGLVAGALVCLDVDGSGRCDPGEPLATTADDGSFELAAAPSSTAALLAELSGTSRVDGVALGRALVLRAPAGSNWISPLSTLLAAEMAQSGDDAERAEARLTARAGVSLRADFRGADGAAASQLAWLAERTGAAQRSALAPAVGAGRLTAADVERETLAALAAGLRELANAASAGATASDATLLAAALGPNEDTVAFASRMVALAAPPEPTEPQAGFTLQTLRYNDADNWFMRTLESSAADNVPDIDGNRRYVDVYARSASPSASMPAGIVERWNGGGLTPEFRFSAHWNGSAWVGCGLDARYRTSVADPAGRSNYDFCDGRERGHSVRRYEDISGLDMAFVLRDKIRTFPGGTNGVLYRDFGPVDTTPLEGRNFPPGSFLYLQVNTISESAVTFDTRPANRRVAYPASVAAGGNAVLSPGIDCANPSIAVLFEPSTLEQLIAGAQGRPCTVTPDVSTSSSLDPNEWWGNSTQFLGELPNFNTIPPGTGIYYDSRAMLRVAFRGTDRALFYNCLRRASDGSTRNCTVLGQGRYRIDTLGSLRVLSFTTLPAVVQRIGNYAPVFVESGGAVYYGTRGRTGVTSTQLRLGTVAASALLDALNMPPVRPVTQPGTATGARADALATAQGAWGQADATSAVLLRFGADGYYLLAEAKPPEALTREQSGAELGWFDLDPATGQVSALIEVDSNLTAGFSHPRADDAPITIEAERIGSTEFEVPRLRDDLGEAAETMVGLWALDEAIDPRVPHLALFANGRGMFVTSDAEPDCLGGLAPGECPPGVEFFEWSYDPVEGVLRLFNPLYDTNGCAGLFDGCPSYSDFFGTPSNEAFLFPSLAADRRSFLSFADDVERTFYRVPPRP